jgi:molecular chaperone DnaK
VPPKEAGQIASLKVMRIVNEPTAAALAYGSTRRRKSSSPSTTSAAAPSTSILEVDGVVESRRPTATRISAATTSISASSVDHRRVQERKGSTSRRTAWRCSAREAAEGEDGALHRRRERDQPAVHQRGSSARSISSRNSRGKFEPRRRPAAADINLARQALADAGVAASAVDEVVLVGGSTRVLRQPDRQGMFSKGRTGEPRQVVAIGAAVQAGVLSAT